MSLLNFLSWQETEVVETDCRLFVKAIYTVAREFCPRCFSSARQFQKYGSVVRRFTDAPVRGKPVRGVLKVQKYKCLTCGRTCFDSVPELKRSSKFTNRLISYIERQCIKNNFLNISCETGISEGAVRRIFEQFAARKVGLITAQTPVILGIDDVYIGRIARCILTDIKNKKVIEILPKRDLATVYQYFINLKDKKKIKVVTMDMCRPFFNVVREMLPHSEIVIDTFHVQRMANQATNLFLKDLRHSLNLSQRRVCLHDRFILMKRNFNLNAAEKELLLRWKGKLPLLGDVYNLKEEFFRIWRFSDRVGAEKAYLKWEESIPPEIQFVFRDILSTIENWHHEVFNYFDFKVTNAFTESANSLVKNVQKQTRGCSFEVVRLKILYRYLK